MNLRAHGALVVVVVAAGAIAACTGTEGEVIRPDGAVVDMASPPRPDAGPDLAPATDRPVVEVAPEAAEEVPEAAPEAPVEVPADLPADLRGDVTDGNGAETRG